MFTFGSWAKVVWTRTMSVVVMLPPGTADTHQHIAEYENQRCVPASCPDELQMRHVVSEQSDLDEDERKERDVSKPPPGARAGESQAEQRQAQ